MANHDDEHVFSTTIGWHTLARSSYPEDLGGLARFLYAHGMMSVAVAESQCLSSVLEDEELEEEECLRAREKLGLTCCNIGFFRTVAGQLYARNKVLRQGCKKFSVDAMVTITRTTPEESFKHPLLITCVDSCSLHFTCAHSLPEDILQGLWRLDLYEPDYVLPWILTSVAEFST